MVRPQVFNDRTVPAFGYFNAMRVASETGDISKLRYLLESISTPVGQGFGLEFFWAALCFGQLDVLKLVLDDPRFDLPVTSFQVYFCRNRQIACRHPGRCKTFQSPSVIVLSRIPLYLILKGVNVNISPSTSRDITNVVRKFPENPVVTKSIIKFFPRQYRVRAALLWFCIVKRGWRGTFKRHMPCLLKSVILL